MIIAQQEGKVNPAFEKWQRKKLEAKEMAKRERAIGELKRAVAMESCASMVEVQVCEDCGQMHVNRARLCRQRLCPICTWRLSMRRFVEMLGIVEALRQAYPESNWTFVTLTVRNCEPEDLKITLDEMSRVWNSIASSKKLKEKIAGWAKATELTYNKRTGQVHPHYHILIMWEELELPNDYIIKRWVKASRGTAVGEAQNHEYITLNETQIGYEVDQNPEDDQAVEAILETYKYTIKSSDLKEMPLSTFRTVQKVLAGRRLTSFGGKIKEYAQLMGCTPQTMDEADGEEWKHRKCVKCGSRKLVDVVGIWAGDSYQWRREQ